MQEKPQLGNAERRRHPRFPMTGPLGCTPVDDSVGGLAQAYGQNISSGGLGLILDQPVRAGTLLRLTIPPERVAEVVHSVRRPDGRWMTGAIFTEPFGAEDDIEVRFLPTPPAVLVIERDAGVRDVVAANFQAHHVGAWPVASVEEGLSVLAQHHQQFTLVLLDASMVQEDLSRTGAEIKSRAPEIPCWLMSGSGERSGADLLEECGVSRIVYKPLHFSTLIADVKRLAK